MLLLTLKRQDFCTICFVGKQCLIFYGSGTGAGTGNETFPKSESEPIESDQSLAMFQNTVHCKPSVSRPRGRPPVATAKMCPVHGYAVPTFKNILSVE
jgi:hypothetical protein